MVLSERNIYYYDSAAGVFSSSVHLRYLSDYLRAEAEAVNQDPVFRLRRVAVS